MTYQNTQLWSECRLVALWNAAKFYNITTPKPGTEQYEQICEDGCCIIGACINIEPEVKRLRLKLIQGKINLNWIKKNLPVNIGIRHPRRGFHAVLVVKANGNKLLLANYAKGRLYWLPWRKIKNAIPRSPNDKVYTYKIKKGV